MISIIKTSGRVIPLRKGVSVLLLLRSFATVMATSMATSSVDQNICIRLARRDDIPSIRQCNLENLPENYSDQFFLRHLDNWPGLTLVAEKGDRLVGYCIGRLELPVNSLPGGTTSLSAADRRPLALDGHIASLAVSNAYRGQGVARNLMKKLHTQFVHLHNVDKVSLHVRCSNTAAIKLYLGNLSYRCVDRVSNYYEDGEDAWRMTLKGLQVIERATAYKAISAGNKKLFLPVEQ